MYIPQAPPPRNSPCLGISTLLGTPQGAGLQTGGLKGRPKENLAGPRTLLLIRHTLGNRTKESARLPVETITELEVLLPPSSELWQLVQHLSGQ